MVDTSALGALKSWLYEPNDDTHFPLENIPFGVAAHPVGGHKICVTRIGDHLVDLSGMEQAGLFDGPLFSALNCKVFHGHETLNKFAAHGKALRIELRHRLQHLFGIDDDATHMAKVKQCLLPTTCKMDLPVFCRDYTDFYSSKNHAYNIGVMVRGPENALQANWLHLPVGYHGRASSIVVDGTPVRRPKG